MLRPAKFKIKMYSFTVYYCLGWAYEDFAKYLKRKHKTTSEDLDNGKDVQGLCYSSTACCYVWVDSTGHADITSYLVTLVHECVHAANSVLMRINAKMETDNDEMYAYLV